MSSGCWTFDDRGRFADTRRVVVHVVPSIKQELEPSITSLGKLAYQTLPIADMASKQSPLSILLYDPHGKEKWPR